MEPGMGTVFSAENPATGGLLYWQREDPNVLGLIMCKTMRALFDRFKNTPFPELGKAVGDFALYDSLMAGTVSSLLDGATIAPDAIPAPDRDTEEMLKVLMKKTKLTKQEAEFVKYAQLLQELRAEVVRAVNLG
jgi:hypothetical protein